ncbi:MAG: hypothetical protein QOG92_1486, partial [Verrucomicrobiota bacterium]|nr:hypothetical protein [Verrucomicrobiota bacterium]
MTAKRALNPDAAKLLCFGASLSPALTRRYLVAPCWKNTRSAGLEVLKGHESIAQALAWVTFFIGNHPHKALPRSALLEKHPVRRVGGAEGAAEIVLP